MSKRILGTADIAEGLGVSKAAVSNHIARYSDTPTADYVTPDGRMFWDSATAVSRWKKWRALLR